MSAPDLADPGQQALASLRNWIVEHCYDKEPIRQTAYGLSISAIVHRLIKYGPDAGLDHLTARDCCVLLVYLNGAYAEWVMRAAFTRALIEGDQEVVERLAGAPFMLEVRNWYQRLCEGLFGTEEQRFGHSEWLASQAPEAKAIGRLMTMRLYPDTASMEWLYECPEDAKLQAALTSVILLAKPAYQGAVEAYVRARPLVRNYLL